MASMQSVQPRVGYTDLLDMPEDGRRHEIHGGELVVVPSPLPLHQLAVLAVVRLFDDYIAERGGLVLTAPLDIVLDEFDVVQPDVVFFRAERRHLVRPDTVTRHAPDVVVEVLSPSTASTDRGRKKRLFARYGVPEYWIVDPLTGRIEVHALDDGFYRETQVAAGDQTVHSVLYARSGPVRGGHSTVDAGRDSAPPTAATPPSARTPRREHGLASTQREGEADLGIPLDKGNWRGSCLAVTQNADSPLHQSMPDPMAFTCCANRLMLARISSAVSATQTVDRYRLWWTGPPRAAQRHGPPCQGTTAIRQASLLGILLAPKPSVAIP